MTGRSRIAVLLTGAMLFAALTLASRALVAKDDVPFKGAAISQFVSEDLPNLTTYWKIVSGNVTHLGKVTGSAEVYLMQISESPPIYVPIGAAITLVAANGDELYITHGNGRWDPESNSSISDYTITGGSGRFAGATGSGTATAAGASTVALSWNGTIDYKK